MNWLLLLLSFLAGVLVTWLFLVQPWKQWKQGAITAERRAAETSDLDTPVMGFPVPVLDGSEAGLAPSFEEGPYPGSARPGHNGAPPTDEFVIKGEEESKTYHTAESPSFDVTRAEVWFRSAADAERAGFHRVAARLNRE